MIQFIATESLYEYRCRDIRNGLALYCQTNILQDRPDAHWILKADDEITASCSLWWKNVPAHDKARVGIIGHYAASDPRTADVLLHHACDQLAQHGCTVAIGPMDGNTWRRYRLVTERGTEPEFFLEPINPEDWPAHFTSNGFTAIAHYVSAIHYDLHQTDPRVARADKRLKERGISVRMLNASKFEEELRTIYKIAIESFQNNFLYSPVEENEFLVRYKALVPYVRPELVLIAENHGTPVGFIFGIPDILQGHRIQTIDTVIVKTLAVLPQRTHAGLGSVLLARCQEVVKELGYTRAIHALMHEQNPSINVSRHTAKPMRRYALYGKRLVP